MKIEIDNYPDNENEQVNWFLQNALHLLDEYQTQTLIKNLNARLPEVWRINYASHELAMNKEQFCNALRNSSQALSMIMLSSAFSVWNIPELKDVVSFEEFVEVYDKINHWDQEFKHRIMDLKVLDKYYPEKFDGNDD